MHTVIEEVFSDEEDEKTKKRKKKERKKSRIEKLFLENEVSSTDDDEEDKPEAWDPPHIMDELKDPAVVANLPAIIASIKGEDEDKEIVWDHGASKKGKKSDENLFIWLEAFSGHECLRKRKLDDLIFEDGGGSGAMVAPAQPPPSKRGKKK